MGAIRTSTRRLVIAGLGNYTHPLTRHSIGQLLLESLIKKAHSLPSASSLFKGGNEQLQYRKESTSWINRIKVFEGTTQEIELLFVKPKKLMNISGPCIISCIKSEFKNFDSWQLLSLQDDLDLKVGSYKVQKGGSLRGHNGLRSLEKALGGTREFWRIRIGVDRPENKSEVPRYVMEPLGRDEVENVAWDDDTGKGGKLVESVWDEVIRVVQINQDEMLNKR